MSSSVTAANMWATAFAIAYISLRSRETSRWQDDLATCYAGLVAKAMAWLDAALLAASLEAVPEAVVAHAMARIQGGVMRGSDAGSPGSAASSAGAAAPPAQPQFFGSGLLPPLGPGSSLSPTYHPRRRASSASANGSPVIHPHQTHSLPSPLSFAPGTAASVRSALPHSGDGSAHAAAQQRGLGSPSVRLCVSVPGSPPDQGSATTMSSTSAPVSPRVAETLMRDRSVSSSPMRGSPLAAASASGIGASGEHASSAAQGSRDRSISYPEQL